MLVVAEFVDRVEEHLVEDGVGRGLFEECVRVVVADVEGVPRNR